MSKRIVQYIQKFQVKHIFLLILLLAPIVLIGVSNYFFAYSSFHNVENARGEIYRQWVGDTDGILMTMILSAIIILLWLIGVFTGKLDNLMTSIPQSIKNRIAFIKSNPKKTAIHAGILISIIIIAMLIVPLSVSTGSKLAWARMARTLFFIASGFSIYFIVFFHRNVEKLFVLLSLSIGFIFIMAHPHYWYGWDNAVHYAYAFEESFVRYASINEVDLALAQNGHIPFSITPAYDGFPQLMTGRELVTISQFHLKSGSLSFIGSEGHTLLMRLAHIPAGIMLFIGRSLVLSPLNILRLGLFANHLIYTAIVYYAIKRLNSGKHLMAIIAMFPTVFVLSTNYGYDYWVIAFAMLGFAYYFNEIQNPNEKIKLNTIITMIGSFIVGMGPKATYISMMVILFFIKRNKFKTTKGHWLYLLAVTLGILVVASIFMIPILTGNTGPGDPRADYSVVSYENQMSFILNNPLTYIGILIDSLKEYLNVFTNSNYVTSFAYMGTTPYFYLTWMLILFVMFTDRNEKDLISTRAMYKVIVSVVAFGTISLFHTAAYIVITPVGYNGIFGAQARYMLPVLFPVLYIIGGFKIENNINKTAYTTGIFSIMSFVLLYGVWNTLIVRLG